MRRFLRRFTSGIETFSRNHKDLIAVFFQFLVAMATVYISYNSFSLQHTEHEKRIENLIRDSSDILQKVKLERDNLINLTAQSNIQREILQAKDSLSELKRNFYAEQNRLNEELERNKIITTVKSQLKSIANNPYPNNLTVEDVISSMDDKKLVGYYTEELIKLRNESLNNSFLASEKDMATLLMSDLLLFRSGSFAIDNIVEDFNNMFRDGMLDSITNDTQSLLIAILSSKYFSQEKRVFIINNLSEGLVYSKNCAIRNITIFLVIKLFEDYPSLSHVDGTLIKYLIKNTTRNVKQGCLKGDLLISLYRIFPEFVMAFVIASKPDMPELRYFTKEEMQHEITSFSYWLDRGNFPVVEISGYSIKDILKMKIISDDVYHKTIVNTEFWVELLDTDMNIYIIEQYLNIERF